jgi:hypothetical protein
MGRPEQCNSVSVFFSFSLQCNAYSWSTPVMVRPIDLERRLIKAVSNNSRVMVVQNFTCQELRE